MLKSNIYVGDPDAQNENPKSFLELVAEKRVKYEELSQPINVFISPGGNFLEWSVSIHHVMGGDKCHTYSMLVHTRVEDNVVMKTLGRAEYISFRTPTEALQHAATYFGTREFNYAAREAIRALDEEIRDVHIPKEDTDDRCE